MLKRKARRRGRRITVGEDKAYDSRDHVTALRRMNVTPHVAQNDALTKTGRRRTSAIDKRTTRHVGYRISQSCRAMVECIFGWGKQHGTMRKTKHRGIAAVGADFMFNLIAYNLVRIPKAHRCLSSDSARRNTFRLRQSPRQPTTTLKSRQKLHSKTVLQQTASSEKIVGLGHDADHGLRA